MGPTQEGGARSCQGPEGPGLLLSLQGMHSQGPQSCDCPPLGAGLSLPCGHACPSPPPWQRGRDHPPATLTRVCSVSSEGGQRRRRKKKKAAAAPPPPFASPPSFLGAPGGDALPPRRKRRRRRRAMGLCVTKDLFTNTQKDPPLATPQPDPPPAAPHDIQEASNSPNPTSSSSSGGGYNVTVLATSSLVGLVQSIKDHITKPTAMAQGRVAHLIEWKGWSAPQAGRELPLTDEELYADLTDELKEARFAAGVAEQFAIMEATLSAWSSVDEEELHYWGASQDAVQLQDLETLYLPEHLLLSPQALSSPSIAQSLQAFLPSSQEFLGPKRHSVLSPWSDSSGTGSQGAGSEQTVMPTEGGQTEGTPRPLWLRRSTPSLRYVDSSSLSEDDVFYN
ncbi:protein FAM131C [Sceloporus undulatus]|uniref:protein FAM131C n=1 Tax=Sceloporus undulatus TaxID=8520 RepID=UPI001C4A9711|nr:protein FAM131C [Sceloporus undulatus]